MNKRLIDLLNPTNIIGKNIATKAISVPYPFNRLQVTITSDAAFYVYYRRENKVFNGTNNEQIGSPTYDNIFKQFYAAGQTAQITLPGDIVWHYNTVDGGTIKTGAINTLYVRSANPDNISVQFTLPQAIRNALQDPNQIQMRFSAPSPYLDKWPFYYESGLDPIEYTGAAWAKTTFKGKELFAYVGVEDLIPSDAGAEIMLYGDLKVLALGNNQAAQRNDADGLTELTINGNDELQAVEMNFSNSESPVQTYTIQNTPAIDRMQITAIPEIVANGLLDMMRANNGHGGAVHSAGNPYCTLIEDNMYQADTYNWWLEY